MTDWSHNAENLQYHNEDIKLTNIENKEFLITELNFESAMRLEMEILEIFMTAMVESHPSRNKN